MVRTLALILTCAAFLMLAVGCSDNGSQSLTSDGNLNLEDAFGGYTSSSEVPAFGDDELVAAAYGEEEVEDDLISRSQQEALANSHLCGFYHFRAVWGSIPYNSTVTEVTDWSGSLTISRGTVVVRHVVRFEPGQDYLLPREDRQTIEWVSSTTVHNDGIGVDIYIPREYRIDTTVVDDEEVIDTVVLDCDDATLTFETGPYSRTFSVRELIGLDTVIYLEDSVNAVALHGFRLDYRPCPRGFMSGTWGYDPDGQGVFSGLWLGRQGAVIGHYHGHFGIADDGARVFFGKVISRNGNFEYFLRGIWGPRPNHHANPNALHRAPGKYVGGIFTADGARVGVVQGQYRTHPAHKSGFMQGRWKVLCNYDSEGIDDDDSGGGRWNDDDYFDEGFDDSGNF
jgi:hypothetical protein